MTPQQCREFGVKLAMLHAGIKEANTFPFGTIAGAWMGRNNGDNGMARGAERGLGVDVGTMVGGMAGGNIGELLATPFPNAKIRYAVEGLGALAGMVGGAYLGYQTAKNIQADPKFLRPREK